LGAGAPPTEWNVESGKNIRWKTVIPGLGHSSPVVWGDRIFVTSAVPAAGESSLKVGLYGDIAPVKGEPAQSFNVYCLDRKSGKILWERVAASGPPKIMRHPKSTHANPTPATDGKHPVVFFGSEGLFNYDLDGKLLWKKDFGVLDSGFYMVPSAQWGFASSPVIHENMVVLQVDVQKDSFVAALDIETGKEIWRTPRNDVPTFGSPAVVPYTAGGAKGWQVVVNGYRHIAGYDLKTGKELWSLKGGGDIPVPTPVFGDGLVVMTNAHGKGRPIYAIRTDAAGDITDSKSAIAWTEERGGNYMQTPLLDNGLGYFCFEHRSAERLQDGHRGTPISTAAGWRDIRLHQLGGGRRRPSLHHQRGRPQLRAGARPGVQAARRKRYRRNGDGHGRDCGWRALPARRQALVRHRREGVRWFHDHWRSRCTL
jgi:outer membrane protein assembly factor BamB